MRRGHFESRNSTIATWRLIGVVDPELAAWVLNHQVHVVQRSQVIEYVKQNLSPGQQMDPVIVRIREAWPGGLRAFERKWKTSGQ